MSADEDLTNTPRTRPEVRLSHAEREAYVERLKTAQDEGRITLDEFEERVGRVYAAKVGSEIGDVLDDLPALQPPPPAGPPTTSTDDTVDVHATARRARWMVSIFGARKNTGRWTPGAPSRTFTMMGSQTLDLTEVDAQEVDIQAFTLIGETRIIVPPGATVEMTGFILIGETANKMRNYEGQSTMRVRVRSFGAIGECVVRTPGKRAAINKLINKKLREID